MEKKSNRIYLLEEAGVASALLKLGIPTMAVMLISALYNTIDSYFVGGLGMSQMGPLLLYFQSFKSSFDTEVKKNFQFSY